ncbi:hypothetical protein DRQ09_03690, partial [candidate division KSB1 bacterium]
YRHDNTRSGITSVNLHLPLSLSWVFESTHKPEPAWPLPGEEIARAHSDNAFHVTISNGKVYFGSSVNNRVYALDVKTGEIKWSFFAEGPVRFAPTIYKNRVYAGSDDGYVYCLKAGNGKLIWKYRAGSDREKVIGNGRMISLWPVRTSILVDNGTVYFCAGVFPYEGIYICALNAEDGSIIWKNDTVGDREHELAYGGISPQSYLLASENILYVPSGRAMPAAFDKRSGEFLYYCLPGAKIGGTWALLEDNNIVAGVDWSGTPAKVVYDAITGRKKEDAHAWFPGIDMVVTPDYTYTLTEKEIFSMNRAEYQIALKKVITVKEKRQKLREKLKDIGEKLRTATKDVQKILNNQKESISQKINELNAEERKLKDSVRKWECPVKDMYSLILSGKILFAGGNGKVITIDTDTGEKLWKADIDGKAFGLAVIKGNLFISTDNGKIYCFKEDKKSEVKNIKSIVNFSPYTNDKFTKIYESVAEQILSRTGIKKGYCLVLDSGTGRFAFELAKRSELKIIGIEKDPEKVYEAKNKLDAAGLYGSRVVIEQWNLSELPDYFANLIVSDEMIKTGKFDYSLKEVYRVLKPYGGIIYLGQSSEESKELKLDKMYGISSLLKYFNKERVEIIRKNGLWVKIVRGKLEGAGNWTELYGNPQNTACSGDKLVESPLGVLWFGEPGPEKMVERHAKAVSPVSMNGRLFIQGEEIIMAYDAYNGTPLWERKIPGAIRARADVDGGNLALTEDGLYVAAYDNCYKLNPATGETIKVFKVPMSSDKSSRRWGYVSCSDRILYGSRAMPLKRGYFALWENIVDNGKWRNENEISPEFIDEYKNLVSRYPVPDEKVWADFKRSGALWRLMADYPEWEIYKSSKGAITGNMMVSDMVFAMDSNTGKMKWKYKGHRIAHITITRGDNKIFFAESSVSEEQKKQAIEEKNKLIEKGIYEKTEGIKIDSNSLDIRAVVCLDAITGKKLWKKSLDFTGCGGDGMGAAYSNGVLLFFGNIGNHDAWRFQQNTLRWRRITALSAESGEVLWSKPINYRTRPVIIGDQIIIEPRICNLYTGKIKMCYHPITGEEVPREFLRPGHTCAISSASANLLFYRSYCCAMYDFSEDRGITLFGGIRPGCWISMIPACGVLLSPEASSGCTCSFPLRCSFVLKTKKDRVQPWSVFITHSIINDVKHFAINLGAPADMKDNDGIVWFAYPNPETEYIGNHFPDYGVKFNLHEKIVRGMGYFYSDYRSRVVEGTDKPWLFTSGCVGFLSCKIPVIDDIWGDGPGIYTVRLGFNALSGDRVGQRVFDIIIQGKPVLKDFDIVKEAGNTNKAVIKVIEGVVVEDSLKIEFHPKEKNPLIKKAPLVNFIELIREDTEKVSVIHKIDKSLGPAETEKLLKNASIKLKRRNYNEALRIYHTVLDRSPQLSFKLRAMKGMAIIKSPESLNRIAKYCKDVDPIILDYRKPTPELRKAALKVFISIADGIAKKNRQRAIKMLKYAVKVSGSDIRKQAIISLKKLGVVINN